MRLYARDSGKKGDPLCSVVCEPYLSGRSYLWKRIEDIPSRTVSAFHSFRLVLVRSFKQEPHVEEALYRQLNKLAANAVVNSLTALLECDVGTLYSARWPWLLTLIEQILKEASVILMSLPLPCQDLKAKFTDQRLGSMVEAFAKGHACHKPHIMRDVINRTPTEMDYINGVLSARTPFSSMSHKAEEKGGSIIRVSVR
ncbi:hypothetical protein HRG_012067 [Hirsutella rhossiliensis]